MHRFGTCSPHKSKRCIEVIRSGNAIRSAKDWRLSCVPSLLLISFSCPSFASCPRFHLRLHFRPLLPCLRRPFQPLYLEENSPIHRLPSTLVSVAEELGSSSTLLGQQVRATALLVVVALESVVLAVCSSAWGDLSSIQISECRGDVYS